MSETEIKEYQFKGAFWGCWSDERGNYTMIATSRNEGIDILCADQELIIAVFDEMHGMAINHTMYIEPVDINEVPV